MAREFGEFWSCHNHALWSSDDALSSMHAMVKRAEELGYPALSLNDHGRVTGNLQLYKECRKRGIKPIPGIELYVTPNRDDRVQGHNMHLTVNAYTEQGYKNLCRLVTTTAKNFYYKPRVDLADLAQMAEDGATQGLSIATGCWFGLLPTVMRTQGYRPALALLETLAGWFPRVYVELQAHGIDPTEQSADAAWVVSIDGEPSLQLGEDEMICALVDLAEDAGIPHIITTDAHYVMAADQPLHNGLKQLCSWGADPEDAIFPGGPYCMMGYSDLKSYFERDVLDRSCTALAEFADAASVRIPALDTFKMLVPNVALTADPDAELARKVFAGLEAKGRANVVSYVQRCKHELDIIAQTAFAPYLLLIIMICERMRAEGIVFCVRGSANDSLVNWATGMTNVDAGSKGWDLQFEAFISPDRIKPPDVDLDIEHARCAEVTNWLGTILTVCQVGTISHYKLYDEEEDEGKGSLRVRYMQTVRKDGNIHTWQQAPAADKKMLTELAERGLMRGYGTHAAALILAPDAATIADLPMTRIGVGPKAHLGTCYGKDDVEDLGFIKGDFLGSRTLTAVSIATGLIQQGHDTVLTPMDYLETIPRNDRKVFSRLAGGHTEGIFQLQKRPSTEFIKRMRPKNLQELVAAMALVRPAARLAGTADAYLSRRKGTTQIPPMHADLMAVTADTYGTIPYQEQVIELCRIIGMEMADLNKILKAIKASNDYVAGAKLAIAEAMPLIRHLAGQRGWSDDDVTILREAVEGYGDYGFKKGHAVGYGQMSYWTGWLAENHPLPWWTGVLTAYANEEEEIGYVTAARRYGVRIMRAHVNQSGVSYSLDRRLSAIRRGLISVKGVGSVSAAELAAHAPYESLADLARRVVARRVSGAKQLLTNTPVDECGGVIGHLYERGALEGLE